jgi:methyl-accepting chemotaxis protein
MTSPSRIRRTHYLVKRRLQLGLALRFLLILVLFAMFMLFEAWMTVWPVITTYLPDAAVPEVLGQIAFRLAVFSLPIGLVILAIVVVLTHRVAGPLLRIERTLDAALAGKKTSPIRLRKRDELKGLCDRVNRVTERLTENERE